MYERREKDKSSKKWKRLIKAEERIYIHTWRIVCFFVQDQGKRNVGIAFIEREIQRMNCILERDSTQEFGS